MPSHTRTMPIHIDNYNANRQNLAISLALQSSNVDILLLSEPWWENIGNDIRGPVHHGGYTPILPVQQVPDDKAPRVMAYVRTRADFTITLRSDLASDLDFQILELRQDPHPPILLVNMYNREQADDARLTTFDRFKLLQLPDMPTIISGDMNVHHPMWESWAPNPGPRAVAFVDWMDNNDFSLLNQRDEVTFIAHRRQGNARPRSVLDLTFANVAAQTLGAVSEWAVCPDRQYTSDHFPLTWKISLGEEEILNPLGVKYNFKHADVDKWKSELRRLLDASPAPFVNLRENPNPSEDDLDLAAEAMRAAMQAATAVAVPERKVSKRSKPWWTQELTTVVQRLKDDKAKARDFYRRWGEPSRALEHDARATHNFLRRAIQRAKRVFFDQRLTEATVADIWDMRKWGLGRRDYPSPSIRRPDGSMAVDHQDKCSAMMDELFQPAPDLPGVAMPDLDTPLAGAFPYQEVTRTEVKEAIWAPKPDKAAGDDHIPFTALRWAWEIAGDELYFLVRRCASAGYHPKCWKSAIACALRKPKKPDYSNPRAWRLIQLLACLGKVLEKIQARRLAYYTVKYNLVPTTQFGSVPASSTVDASLTFLHDVQAARSRGLVTGSLAFDIKGYFDFVNHPRLVSVLKEKKIPLPIVKWAASFLSGRSAAVCLDGRMGTYRPVDNGIPQGSPVSGIFSAFYTAGLLEKMAARAKRLKGTLPERGTPTTTTLYVDDGRLWCHALTLEACMAELQDAYQEVMDWLKSAGLSPDFGKTEFIVHGWRRNLPKPLPHISLPGADGVPVAVEPSDAIKCLGVFFDQKLNFRRHIRVTCEKAKRTAAGLRILGNSVRGLSQEYLRRLYISCVLPILTYASPVWWQQRVWQVEAIDRAQNVALRHICGAFRTSPIRALQVEAAVLPARHSLDLQFALASTRLHKLNEWSPVLQRLGGTWKRTKMPRPPITRVGRKPTQLQKLANMTAPGNEHLKVFPLPPWRLTISDAPVLRGRLIVTGPKKGVTKRQAGIDHKAHIAKFRNDPAHLIIYTDGSLLEHADGTRGVGAGSVIYYLGRASHDREMPLGARAEVYDAEMQAISMAIDDARSIYKRAGTLIRHLHFYSDNSSAVSSIFDTYCGPAQKHSEDFRSRVLKFLHADLTHTVELAWAPGHVGIVGNERADKRAKSAAEQAGPRSATYSHLRRRAREIPYEKWRKDWTDDPIRGAYAPAVLAPPSRKPPRHFFTLTRQLYGLVTQCRLGHCFTGEYYDRFVHSESTACPCGHPLQTRSHILKECEQYDDHRHVLRKISPGLVLSEILGTKDGIAALAHFISLTGAFTKTGEASVDKPLQPLILTDDLDEFAGDSDSSDEDDD